MQMSKREIYTRFKNMEGKPESRMEILAQLNGCHVKYIKEILQDVAADRCDEPEYIPESHFEQVKISKGDIPEKVLDMIFDRLDELDREIKQKQDEYKELVEFIGGKA